MTTAKSINEELQNRSSIILSAGPENREKDIKRVVILSNAAIAASPEGIVQMGFRLPSKKESLCSLNTGITDRC